MVDTHQISDPLYPEAVRMVVATQRASVSMLQRRLTIGYNRGLHLILRMEQEGIVGPLQATGIRAVLRKEVDRG